jgi:hypothetical protein
MPDFTQKTDFSKLHDLNKGEIKTPLERFLSLMGEWAGIKYDKAVLHLDPKTVDNLGEVTK